MRTTKKKRPIQKARKVTYPAIVGPTALGTYLWSRRRKPTMRTAWLSRQAIRRGLPTVFLKRLARLHLRPEYVRTGLKYAPMIAGIPAAIGLAEVLALRRGLRKEAAERRRATYLSSLFSELAKINLSNIVVPEREWRQIVRGLRKETGVPFHIRKTKDFSSYDPSTKTIYYEKLSDVPHEICVDVETECLTPNGFKFYNELKEGDMIYTENPKTLEGELKPIQKMHIYQHNEKEKMVSIESKNLSALVTKMHEWFVRFNWKYKNHHFINCTVRFIKTKDITSDTTAKVPLTVKLRRNLKPIYSNDYVKLIGWIVTEGKYGKPQIITRVKDRKGNIRPGWITHKKNEDIVLTQSYTYNKKKVIEIKKLLSRFGFNQEGSYLKDGSWQISLSGSLIKKIRQEFPGKTLTYDFINFLTNKQLKILKNTLIKGDGSFRKRLCKNGTINESRRFFNTDKNLIDIFQYINFLLGINCSFQITKNEKKKDLYTATVKKTEFAGLKNDKRRELIVKEIDYEGIVWCPETENHTFVARRKGKIYITGNSHALSYEQSSKRERNHLDKLYDDFFQKTGVFPDFKKMWREYVNILPEEAGANLYAIQKTPWKAKVPMALSEASAYLSYFTSIG